MASESSVLVAEIINLLPETYENLHLDVIILNEVGHYNASLLRECAKNFYSLDKRSQSIKFTSANQGNLLKMTKLLLDLTWEQLNTGHWKDVCSSWRHLYSYTSLFRVLAMLIQHNNLQDVIRTCDMGLLMGAPVLNNILAKVASILSKEIHRTCLFTSLSGNTEQIHKKLSPCKNLFPEKTIISENCPSLERFSRLYYLPQNPVHIKGALLDWPALSSKQWNISYLLQVAACRTIPVEIGSKYTDKTWAQELMTMQEFVDTYIVAEAPPAVGYCAQHQLLEQICELSEDVNTPIYCFLGEEEPDVHCWFGPGGTVSPLHFDPKHNCLAQVFGEKYVCLFPPDASSSLYPFDSALLENTSQVDFQNPNLKEFPLFESAARQECILKPGDLLYIPPKWWHFVRSLDNSFSISFWFS